MGNMLFIAAGEKGFDEKLGLAKNLKIGMEVLQFLSYENIYNEGKISSIKKKVSGLPLVIHGPYELFSISDDEIVRKTVMGHLKRVLYIAKILNAKRVVFHTGYISDSKSKKYDEKFIRNASDFFSRIKSDIEICIENVRETPELMKRILPPEMKICIDVGHLNVYSKSSLVDWLNEFGDRITHAHLHNNYGVYDDHSIEGNMNLVDISRRLNCDLSIEAFGDIGDLETLARKIIEKTDVVSH